MVNLVTPLAQHRPLLLAGVLASLVLVAPRVSSAPVEAAPSTLSVPAESLSTVPGPQSSTCWISGDLVGDANPAQVYARICGASPQTLPVTN